MIKCHLIEQRGEERRGEERRGEGGIGERGRLREREVEREGTDAAVAVWSWLCCAGRLHHSSCDSAHIKDRLVFRGGHQKKRDVTPCHTLSAVREGKEFWEMCQWCSQ